MSEQPEALRLADEHFWTDDDCASAAAELRRLHALCEEMGEALSRLLDSDPNGAIATASDEVLLRATYDTQADAIVREQAAAILQARVARSKWKESR